MPIYEYQCKTCGKTTEASKPLSGYKDPLSVQCLSKDDKVCELDRILSPTTTDFKFNDFRGHRGFNSRRGTQ